MKLAAKLVLTVVLGIAVVLVIDGYVSLKRQHDLFEADMHHDIRTLGLAMRQLVADTWSVSGREHAWRMIEDANTVEPSVDIRWVWLDVSQEDPCAPRVSLDRLGSVMQGQDVPLTERNEKGQGNFYYYFPVSVESQRAGALEIQESLSQLDRLNRMALIKIVALTSTLIFLSTCAAVLLGIKRVGRPLDQVVRKIRRIGTGDFSGPLKVAGHDEIDELAFGVNAMCEQLTDAWAKVRLETEARIAALEQLRHEDRLKTVGRLASGIAHELGTPLNVISGYAGMIAGGSLPSLEISEIAHTIKAQSDRIAGIIRQLLDFARRRPGQRKVVDLRSLVDQTLELMIPLAQKQAITLQLNPDSHTASVKADVEQVKQVLLNLISNAMQAMPQGGLVQVAIEPASSPPPVAHADPTGQYMCISVQDQGEGISEKNLSHIFEPFFTTKETGKGTGLGLSIAEGIIREHGGWIAVHSEQGKGSRFSVCLPRERDP